MNVKLIVAVVVLVLGAVLVSNAVFTVHETERALLLRFGAVERADIEPGLHIKMPIAEDVRKFDGRVLTLDAPAARYYTLEKKPLVVDMFAKWKVGDVQRYYTASSGDETRARNLLQERVNEGLRNQISRRDMHEVISGERDQLMQDLTRDLNEVMSREMGVNVIDVRVKKIDLPPEVSVAVYERMNSERQIEARQYPRHRARTGARHHRRCGSASGGHRRGSLSEGRGTAWRGRCAGGRDLRRRLQQRPRVLQVLSQHQRLRQCLQGSAGHAHHRPEERLLPIPREQRRLKAAFRAEPAGT